MAYRNDWIKLIRALASKYKVDPQAALAVASTEGLSGGRGDAGTSAGPFQLHRGGALPADKSYGWAESPSGIEYALRQIGSVAGGLTGPEAVNAIVSKFERPANPSREIQLATSRLGQFGGGMAADPSSPVGARPPAPAAAPAPDHTPNPNIGLALSLLGKGSGGSLLSQALQIAARRQQQAAPSPQPGPPAQPQPMGIPQPGAPSTTVAPTRSPGGALAEAFYDPLGQYDNGRFSSKGIGGHSDHVHLSVTAPKAMLAAIEKARAMGLAARENPYSDPVDPVHVPKSFHYRTFPGKYNGRSLGQGLDVSGSSKAMSTFYKWATANLR